MELPFRNYRGRSLAKWKAREDKIEEAKKQKTPESADQEWNSGRPQVVILDLNYFISHLLPGENGAHARRVSVPIGNHQPTGVAHTQLVCVPIGSQLIGTAQMKRARLRHGNHQSHGSEENEYIIYEDIYKDIHDDENNVCLRPATTCSSFLPLALFVALF